jgi:hypothetical protein
MSAKIIPFPQRPHPGVIMPAAQIDQDIVAVAIMRGRLEELQKAIAAKEARIAAAVERGEVASVAVEMRP